MGWEGPHCSELSQDRELWMMVLGDAVDGILERVYLRRFHSQSLTGLQCCCSSCCRVIMYQ